MGKTKKFILILALFGFLAAGIGAKARTWASSEGSANIINLDINELLSEPKTYMKGTVEFECRFATVGKLFRKNNTEFNAEEHINIAVWQPEARLWSRQDRLNVMPSLYINKENSQLCQVVSNLPRYRRIAVRGRVISNYANLPWIEVTAIRVLEDDRMNDQLLQQVAKIHELLKDKKVSLASNLFSTINNETTPDYIRCELNTAIALATPVKKKSDPSLALVSSARRSAGSGDFAAAIAMMKEARKFRQDLDKTAWFNQEMAEYYLRSELTDRLELAREKLIIANSIKSSSDARILNQLADIEMQRDNLDEAEKYIRLALSNDKDNSQAQKRLAQITSDKLANEEKQASQSAQPAIDNPHLASGRNFLNNGDFVNAEAQLRLAINDNNEQAASLLASALLAQGKVDEAKSLLLTAQKSIVKAEVKAEAVKEKSIIPVEPRASETIEKEKNNDIPQSVETNFDDVFATMNEMKNDLKSSAEDQVKDSQAVALNTTAPQVKSLSIEPVKDSMAQKPVTTTDSINIPKLPDIQAAPKARGKLPDWAR